MKLVPTVALLLISIGIAGGILITVLKRNSTVARVSNSTSTSDNTHPEKPVSESTGSWAMFRGGPALLGIAPGKLTDSLKLRWKFKTGDAVKSSAVMGGGRVFIGSNDGNVYAIDLVSGKKAWSFQTEDAVEAPPCLLNDTVFIGSSDSFLYALEAKTGNLK